MKTFFGVTSTKRCLCVFPQKLDDAFRTIIRDFAQILKDFSQTFDKSKVLWVRLHPLHPRLFPHSLRWSSR